MKFPPRYKHSKLCKFSISAGMLCSWLPPRLRVQRAQLQQRGRQLLEAVAAEVEYLEAAAERRLAQALGQRARAAEPVVPGQQRAQAAQRQQLGSQRRERVAAHVQELEVWEAAAQRPWQRRQTVIRQQQPQQRLP